MNLEQQNVLDQELRSLLPEESIVSITTANVNSLLSVIDGIGSDTVVSEVSVKVAVSARIVLGSVPHRGSRLAAERT